MPINAKDLREFAKQNCGSSADEATLRASASRAYYAAYHALLPFVECLPVSDAGDPRATTVGHREMLRRLREWRTSSMHPKLAGMGATKAQLVLAMRALRETREVADYHIDGNMSRNEVVQQVERCRKVLGWAIQIQQIRTTPSVDVA